MQWESGAPTEVVKVNPDGTTGDPFYYSSSGIGDGAFSHDGSKLALTLGSGVVVLDANTGETVTAWNDYQLPEGIDGFPSSVQWVADSSAVVVELGVNRDGCGPGHLVLGMDGNAQFIAEDGCDLTSPNGQLMAAPGSYGCLLTGADVLRVVRFNGRQRGSALRRGPSRSHPLGLVSRLEAGADSSSCRS